MKKLLLEVCANGIHSAINAQQAGADRIELCENLDGGGTTPSSGTIKLAREKLSIPIHVLIRPRAGDFIYSNEEFEIMKRDIEFCQSNGINGVVLAVLKSDGTIDMERCKELVQLAKPMSITFQRAFDFVKDPFVALEEIISLGCDRILTSGQKQNVLEGSELIHHLVQLANNRIILLAGAGINEENIQEVVRRTGTNEFHFSAKGKVESEMKYKKEGLNLGSETADEFSYFASNENRIRKIKELAEKTFYSKE